MHAAAFGDHVECLQMLLKHKAQIDNIDNLGRSPLMLASQLGQFNIVGQSIHTQLATHIYIAACHIHICHVGYLLVRT